MKIIDKGYIEEEHYPKNIPMIVGAAIRAKRCHACGNVYFTNAGEIIKCRNCQRSA